MAVLAELRAYATLDDVERARAMMRDHGLDLHAAAEQLGVGQQALDMALWRYIAQHVPKGNDNG